MAYRWASGSTCFGSELLPTVHSADVAPHPMPVHLGHLNFEPVTVGEAVDKWHRDTLPLDYVLVVTDPTSLPGGQFEYGRSRCTATWSCIGPHR